MKKLFVLFIALICNVSLNAQEFTETQLSQLVEVINLTATYYGKTCKGDLQPPLQIKDQNNVARTVVSKSATFGEVKTYFKLAWDDKNNFLFSDWTLKGTGEDKYQSISYIDTRFHMMINVSYMSSKSLIIINGSLMPEKDVRILTGR